MILVNKARLSTYTTDLIEHFEVLKESPWLSSSSHLNRGLRNIMKRYRLNVSPCIIP
jgi:hypothetical protein